MLTTPLRISESPQRSDDLKPDREPEPTKKPSSARTDSKTLSSEESSEDEEDIKEEAQKECEATSILPSSVLDRASAIAQHFTNSIKRGSQAQDDGHSLGCVSPRLPSRTSNSLSLGVEPADHINSISSDSTETFDVTDLTLLSPRGESLFDANRCIQRRRDSTLSKQDQLLICKIKSYYEIAESQSATFSLQRRESLSYIPTGLVRSSVSRFNSIPKEEIVQTSSSTPIISSSLESALITDTQGQMVFSDSMDSLKSDQRSTDPEDSEENQMSGSQSVQVNPSEDEEFRPSSEMIKIWQTMEQEISRSQREDIKQENHQEAPRAAGISISVSRKAQNKSCDQDSEDVITGEPMSPSALQSLKECREEPWILKAPIPRVAQLKAEAEVEQPNEDDVEETKSKVLHLARQYSQRIKMTKTVVRKRSQGLLIGKKSLPCVMEEKENAGM